MRKSTPLPRWFPPISFVIIPLMIGLASFSSTRFVPFTVTVPAAMLVAIIWCFCKWPALIRWVAAMPVPHRVIFGVVVGGMICGHYTIDSRTYYPYVAWCIFPQAFRPVPDPVTCHQFIGTTAAGNRVRLLPEQLFPSVIQILPVDSLSPQATDHLASAMTKMYNRLHPADPVRRIDLVVMAVKLHPSASESRAEPSCQLLQRYDFSAAPWN